MKRLLAMLGIPLLAGASMADQVLVPIVVHQVTHVRTAAHPFPAVGPFRIQRGDQLVANSSCPDLSNQEGRLVCSIPCDKADRNAKPLRVVPPIKTRAHGYVAPVSANIELVGCSITPAAPPPFLYKESKYFIRTLLAMRKELEAVISVSADGGQVTLAPVEGAIPVMTQIVATPEGAETLASLNTAMGALLEVQQADPKSADLLSSYLVGINNVFLAEAAKKATGKAPSADFKLTGKKADYYSNLRGIEKQLDSRVGRSAQQTRFLNVVKDLKGQPIDPLRNEKLYERVLTK
jgi:hypothetical protein